MKTAFLWTFLVVVTFTQNSRTRELLTTVKCDGRGNFVNVMEFGVSIVGVTSVQFEVKACGFFIIVLTASPIIKDRRGNYVLTILGYKRNTKISVRDSCYTCPKGKLLNKKNLLKCKVFMPFWMSWDEVTGVTHLGQGDEVGKNLVFSFQRQKAGPFYFIHVTSAKNSIAYIKFFKSEKTATVQFVNPSPGATNMVNISEDSSVGSKIFEIEMTKKIEKPDFEITSNNSDLFKCSSFNVILKKQLDYEDQTMHLVTIRYGRQYASFIVSVGDVNDEIPTTRPAVKRYPLFRHVYAYRDFLIAEDRDKNDNLTVTLLAKPNDVFYLNESGTLFLTGLPPASTYRFFVVTDSAGHDSQCSVTFYVQGYEHITNGSNPGCAKPAKNAAYFEGPAQDGSTIVKVKEGTKAGTQIYMIRVNNVNKPIFRMSGGGEDFVLEGPYLMLRSSLNQTRRGIYFLNIHSGDLRTTMTVEVVPQTVFAVEELLNVRIPEELPLGFVISNTYHVLVEDRYFFEIEGPHTKYLGVNKTTGDVFVKGRIDRESLPGNGYLNFGVRAKKISDISNKNSELFAMWTLKVVDVNDHVPRFPNTLLHVQVAPSDADQVLFLMACVDKDEGPNGNCTVSLVEDFGGIFKLRENELIMLAGSHKRKNPTKPYYILTLITADNPLVEPARTDTTLLVVTVKNKNRFSPYWKTPDFQSGRIARFSIPKDARAGTLITSLEAVDPDDSSALHYTISNITDESGNSVLSSSPFYLSPTTGKLSVLAQPNNSNSLNSNYYELIVTASDGEYAIKTTINITVEHSNMHAPAFDRPVYLVNNTNTDNIVLTFNVTDKDDQSNITLLLSENFHAWRDRQSDWLARTDHFEVERNGGLWILKRRQNVEGRQNVEDFRGQAIAMMAADGSDPEEKTVAIVAFKSGACDDPSSVSGSSKMSTTSSGSGSSERSVNYFEARSSLTSTNSVRSGPSVTSTTSVRSRPYMTSTDELKTTSSTSHLSSVLTGFNDRLVWRSHFRLNVPWVSTYKDSVKGRELRNNLTKQLTKLFSHMADFTKAEVRCISEGAGDIIVRYAVYFRNTADAKTIDAVMDDLRQRPNEIFKTKSDGCGSTSETCAPGTDLMGLKALSVVEGILLLIIILIFIITKTCLSKTATPVERKDTFDLKKIIKELRTKTEDLERTVIKLKDKNVELKRSLDDKFKITVIQEVRDDVTSNVHDDDVINSENIHEGHHGELRKRDSAFWSAHTEEGVSESADVTGEKTNDLRPDTEQTRELTVDNQVQMQREPAVQQEADVKEDPIQNSESLNNEANMDSFVNLVHNAMRFKYVLEDDENKTSHETITCAYTQNSEGTDIKASNEESATVQKEDDSIDKSESQNVSESSQRKTSYLSIFEHPIDIQQVPPVRTTGSSVSQVATESKEISDNTELICSAMNEDPSKNVQDSVSEKTGAEISELLGLHLTYREDMDVKTPIDLRAESLFSGEESIFNFTLNEESKEQQLAKYFSGESGEVSEIQDCFIATSSVSNGNASRNPQSGDGKKMTEHTKQKRRSKREGTGESDNQAVAADSEDHSSVSFGPTDTRIMDDDMKRKAADQSKIRHKKKGTWTKMRKYVK